AMNGIRDEYIIEVGAKLGLLTVGAAGAVGAAVEPPALYSLSGTEATAKAGFGAWVAKGGWIALVAGVVVAAGVAAGVFFFGKGGDVPPVGTGEVTTEQSTSKDTDGETADGTEENGTQEETTAETETQGHVHTYSEGKVIAMPTCAEKGALEYVCPCGSVKTEAIPTLPHTEVIDPGTPPTVSEPGLSDGKHCSVCGKVLVRQNQLPATGHTDLAYEVNEDGRTCTITGMGTCTATEIYIPSSIEGYKVTRIGEIAFIGKPITAVHFPSSVTEIYDGAFHGCTELTEIILPSSITHLGSQAFQACTGLTTATLQCRVTELPHMIFEGCTSLTAVTLPSTLTQIRISAFGNCTALKEITLPASLGIIGPSAFQRCTSLTNVTLPSRLSILDDIAFEGCTSLTEVVLPNTLNRIGANAFSGCSGITAITIPAGVKQAEPSAFERMEGLTDIYFRGTEAEWNAIGYKVGENVRIHFGV
ncbi:MAG: leucine-rich repeat domain-containing protein, partial [Clostridia bacterium]|nr:leucine-rich repeat domain-containing protein [Clostridia bacterium]